MGLVSYEINHAHCIGRSCVVYVSALRAEAVASVGPWLSKAGRGALDEKLRSPATTANAFSGRRRNDVFAAARSEVDASLEEYMSGNGGSVEERMCNGLCEVHAH